MSCSYWAGLDWAQDSIRVKVLQDRSRGAANAPFFLFLSNDIRDFNDLKDFKDFKGLMDFKVFNDLKP